MKKFVKVLCVVLVVLILFTFAACNKKKNKTVEPLTLKDYSIEHETKFGGVYIKITIDDFNAMGFAFGDSVNIEFSNGFKLTDIPYFNGFYVDMGEPLLVGYPGYPYIRAGYNNGDDMWETGQLQSSQESDNLKKLWTVSEVEAKDKATITLNQKAKYLAEQNALDIHYTDTQDGRTNEVFANFRPVNTIASLKPNTLYRSCSPIDNQHNRAHICDDLIEQAGIGFIMDLADSITELDRLYNVEDFDSPYFKSLDDNGNVIPLAMNSAFKSQIFSDKLVTGFKELIQHTGPYLVHCVEGKDRTGFVCVVIEALTGATYSELVNDYMVTYNNYYGINLTTDPEKYNIIKEKNLFPMLRYITGDNGVNIETADYATYTKQYLMSLGMTQTEVDTLQSLFINA